MSDRRVWIVIGVAFAVLLGMLTWSAFDSDETATPSPSLTASPEGSSSPSPTASSSPSSSAPNPSGSASPGTTPTATNSEKPSPNPTSSLADDGLPLVTIERPTSGTSVGIPVEINGTAVAFEAVLRWEILDSKGKRFTNGPAYASAGAPERGLWQIEVELPIGSYTLVAFVESPKDGKRLSEARVKFRAG